MKIDKLCSKGHDDWIFWLDRKANVKRRYCRVCRKAKRDKEKEELKQRKLDFSLNT